MTSQNRTIRRIGIGVPPRGDISTFEMLSIVVVVVVFLLLFLFTITQLNGSEQQIAYPVIIVVLLTLSITLSIIGKRRRKLEPSEIEKI